MEDTVLLHPEIVNPYNLGSKGFNDYAFVNDLSLDTFLHSVPFSSDARYLARRVLVDMNSDAVAEQLLASIFARALKLQLTLIKDNYIY